MIRIRRGEPGFVDVTFVHELAPRADTAGLAGDYTVSVVGAFNGWEPGVHQMRRRSNGTRSARVTVPVGTTLRWRYLGTGGHWFNDPDVPVEGNDMVVTARQP